MREGRHANDAAGGEERGWRLEEEQRLFRDFVAELGGVVSVVTAYAEDFGGGDGSEEMEIGEGFWGEVGGGKGSCGEVFFGSFHEGDGPESVFALLDEGIAGDGNTVLEREKFTVTHL
jgi:hypothetical protein